MDRTARIVIPADDPPMLQNSPHLERLKPYGEVILYRTRPGTDTEAIERCRDALCLINSRAAVKWPARLLERLPKLKMISLCRIGTDSVDLPAARKLGIVV